MAGEHDPDLEIEGDTNDYGLTKDEQAQFDQMRSAEEPVIVEGGGQGADQQQVEGAKAAEQTAGDDDDDDEGISGETGDRAGDQPDGQGKPPRRVAWKRHDREIKAREERIKALEAELGTDKETKARLAERLEIINEAFKGKGQDDKKVDDDPEPDAEQDIFEHNKWMRRQLDKANSRIDSLTASGQQQQADTVLQQSYQSDMQSFVAQEPNFGPAYQHLMASRVIELAEYFFGVDATAKDATLTPQQIGRIQNEIIKEEKSLVKQALDAGQSPSARMFRLAKARGFVPKAAEVAGEKKAEQNGAKVANGEKKAPGSLDSAAEKNGNGVDVRTQIETAKRAVADSASLSEGGGAPTLSLTPERLANMPEHEFTALMDRLSPDQLALIMGGTPQH